MRQFIKLIENLPTSDGWYGEVNGIPKGAPSSRSDEQALYLALWSEFGSLWRGNYFNYDVRRYLIVGYGLGGRGGVLVPTGSNAREIIVAAAEKELGGKIGPATRAAFDALLEKD
jgi:hypothetical protein